MKSVFTLILFFSISSVHAEYRVYQYYVRTKTKNLINVPATLITSTLNPSSYLAYHGGKESIEVNLLRSWQCMGNTSLQQVCDISSNDQIVSQITSEVKK